MIHGEPFIIAECIESLKRHEGVTLYQNVFHFQTDQNDIWCTVNTLMHGLWQRLSSYHLS